MSVKGICFQNLGLMVTNKCNLDCKHCCRGCKNNKDMSKEVIDTVLDQTTLIGNLAICGGEVTLAVPTLEYIITQIIDKHILIDQLTFVTNGTIYSKELLELLDELDKYIKHFSTEEEIPSTFKVSCDKYHIEEMNRLELMERHIVNVERYKTSKHFAGFQLLNPEVKLFREGNACNLDKKLTVPLYQMKYIVTYVLENSVMDKENGMFYVGPLVTINQDGILTECDSSIENQKAIYNYGNVFDRDLKETILQKAKVIKQKDWWKACCKESNKYENYNHL